MVRAKTAPVSLAGNAWHHRRRCKLSAKGWPHASWLSREGSACLHCSRCASRSFPFPQLVCEVLDRLIVADERDGLAAHLGCACTHGECSESHVDVEAAHTEAPGQFFQLRLRPSLQVMSSASSNSMCSVWYFCGCCSAPAPRAPEAKSAFCAVSASADHNATGVVQRGAAGVHSASTPAAVASGTIISSNVMFRVDVSGTVISGTACPVRAGTAGSFGASMARARNSARGLGTTRSIDGAGVGSTGATTAWQTS